MAYNSLLRRYRYQDPREIFAYFPFRAAEGENWENSFAILAAMAQKENWHFNNPNFVKQYANQSYPILTNYLNYTFLRLQEENKIVYSEDNDKACFNTGLQTSKGKDIFVTFFRNKRAEELNQSDWVFHVFCKSDSKKLSPYPAIPELATYITDVKDLIFNTDYSIEPDLDHFLDHAKDRLPPILQENLEMASTLILGAIQSLVGQIRRDYKIAIPHWYENKVQLLLPLVLTNEAGIPDVALVVERDDNLRIYRGKTLLSMDMAYFDARLVTRLSDGWLNP